MCELTVHPRRDSRSACCTPNITTAPRDSTAHVEAMKKTLLGTTAAATLVLTLVAEGRTRTAGGVRKRIQATGSTPAAAEAAVFAKAQQLGAVSTSTANVSTLRQLVDLWLVDMIEPRLILPQTKRMYTTKATELGNMFGAIELKGPCSSAEGDDIRVVHGRRHSEPSRLRERAS